MSDRGMKSAKRIRSPEEQPARGFDLLAVEGMAKAMVQRARRQVEELSRKQAALEEEYRRRREELAAEHRKRREELNEELAQLRRRAEEELAALREEVKSETKKAAFEEGYQEGLLRGRQEGLEAGRAEGLREAKGEAKPQLEAAIEVLRAAASELGIRRHALLRDAEREVVRLAIAVAEKIVKKEIRDFPEAVLNNVRKALDIIGQRTGAVIEVNPDDLALVEKHAPEVLQVFREAESVRFEPNPAVERGGCMVTAGGCGADLRIETQLELIEQALLGGQEAEESGSGKGEEKGRGEEVPAGACPGA